MRYQIRSRKKSADWEEGYFTGNGTIGAIVMCNSPEEKIIFNHEALFLHTNELDGLPDMSDVVRNTDREDYIKYANDFFDIAKSRGLTNKIFPEDVTLYPDRYFPAFEMNIKYKFGIERAYERCLDTSTGEIMVVSKDEENTVRQSVFTSIKRNQVCILLESEQTNHFSFEISVPRAKNEEEEKLLKKCIINKEVTINENQLSYNIEMNRGSYNGVFQFFTNGETLFEKGVFQVRNTKQVFLIVAIAVDETAESLIPAATYEQLYLENLKRYQKEFFESTIELEENKYSDANSEDLFAEIHDCEKMSVIMQKMYYMGRYLTISSYGKLPPNAQGLWSGNVDGRLLCDYVSNIELEMALWAIYAGNFLERIKNCFDFLDGFIPDFEENAKKFFDAPGIVVSSRFTNSGLMFHFSKDYTHQFWIAGGAWLSQVYYDYYLYTKDEAFLKNRALPFMKKAADFYMDYVKSKEIFPSVSPENSPHEHTFCMLGKNAAMDIAVIKELFSNIKHANEILGIKNEYYIELPDYMYEEDGVLKEWADENAAQAYSHRHLSHAYAIMPGTEALHDEKLFAGIDKAIKKRIDNGFYQDGSGTCGWSMMHLINIYARLRKSNEIKTALRIFFEHFVRLNFTTCLNFSTTTFQIDANLGYISALYEMIIYTEEALLILLPCLPDFWKRGHAENILLKGNRIIKEMAWDNEKVKLSILSYDDSVITVRYRNEERVVYLEKEKITNISF